MRNLIRQTQKIWFSVKSIGYTGIDETSTFTKPEMHKFSVSATGSTPEDYAAGIVPDYDRYITSFDRNFHPIEGMQCWVDVTPELNDDGTLKMTDDGEPTVQPDYTLKRKVDTKMGTVARYLIKKNGDEVGSYANND
jgi:hypothetical protein